MSAPPRRWFAFRLSTLVLAVWTLGAAGLIGLRWEAWQRDYVIPERWLGISDENRFVATRSGANEFKVWDLTTAQAVVVRTGAGQQHSIVIYERMQRMTFVEKLPESQTAWLWDLQTQQPLGQLDAPGNSYAIAAVHNRMILRQGVDWDLWQCHGGTQPPIKVLSATSDELFMAPDRSFLLGLTNKVPEVWNLATGERFFLPGTLMGASISSTNRVVLKLPDQRLAVWDLAGNRLVCYLTCPEASSAYFTVDGARVAVSTEKALFWFDAATGAALPSGEWGSTVLQRLAAPDGRVASGNEISFIDPLAKVPPPALFTFPNCRGSCFIPQTNGTRVALIPQENGQPEVWSRHHPEWWWGHFYRPEIWAGIVLAGIWLLKLWRRILRKAVRTAEPAAPNPTPDPTNN